MRRRMYGASRLTSDLCRPLLRAVGEGRREDSPGIARASEPPSVNGAKQPKQLPFQGGAQPRQLHGRQRQSVQDDPVDIYNDFHVAPTAVSSQRKSVSLIGRSALRNSLRAALSSIGIPTGEAAAAAAKAAFRAAL